MTRLLAVLRPRADLTPRRVAEMFRLYETYYGGTCVEVFEEDLAGKSHVIELRAQDRLVGFSTLALLRFELEGAAGRALFSGDTIIHHEFWGEQALSTAFCRFAGQVKAQRASEPLFWLLISKGYRTYRYLGLFAHSYFPHHVAPTPPAMQRRIAHLARIKFGDAYDPATGLVRFAQSRGHLKAQWSGVRAQLRDHPSVRFFLERNPRYAEGEELVCLAELREDNLRSVARRAFVEGFDSALSRALP